VAELAHAVEVVLQTPRPGDSPVLESEEVHLVDPVEAGAGGGLALPLALLGRRTGEACGDFVVLGDESTTFIVTSGKASRNGATHRRAAAAIDGEYSTSSTSSRPTFITSSTSL
jgi:hypothetical protein